MNPLIIKLIALAVIVAIASYFVYNYNHMKSVIKEHEATITTLNNNIAAQNAAVDLLKKETDAKLALGAKALEEAKKNTVVLAGKATTIYKSLPSVPGNDCKSALILGNTK